MANMMKQIYQRLSKKS